MRRNERRKEEVVYGGDTNSSDSGGDGSGSDDIDSDIDVDDAVTDSLYTPTSVELLKKQLSLHWSLHLVADMLGNITLPSAHSIIQSHNNTSLLLYCDTHHLYSPGRFAPNRNMGSLGGSTYNSSSDRQ